MRQYVMIAFVVLLLLLIWNSGSLPLIFEIIGRVGNEFSNLIDNWQGQ